MSVQLPDDKAALYGWAVPKNKQVSTPFTDFYGNQTGLDLIVLEDYNAEGEVYRWLKGGQWVGGICYDIITKKSKGKNHTPF